MKIILLVILFCVKTLQVSAQKSNLKIGTFSGEIVNTKTNHPIPYTKIFLINTKDSSLVAGGLSNEKGTFLISEVPFGVFRAKIISFGFKTKFIDSLNFSKSNYNLNSGSIKLSEDIDLLSVVDVVSETVEIQTAIDKKVFNVEKNITSQGGTALDALQNVPSVTIDMDGNVSLRGSANVTVLIDGRPSSITGSGRQGALETIPASSIESIEIITNPSAKYDPDGMSGIINIVLKKNKMKGFNGNVELGVGTGINYNGSVNLAYRNKFYNIYAGYSLNHYYGYRNLNQTRETWVNDFYNKLIQNRNGTHLRHSNMFKFGTDFYLKNKQTIGFTVTGNLSDNNRTGDMIYLSYDSIQLINSWERISDNPFERNGGDVNVYYEKKFDKKRQKLTFDGSYSQGKALAQGTYSENLLDINGLVTETGYVKQYNKTPDDYSKSNFQIDYFHPLKKGKIETGLKTTLRNTSRSFYQETLDTLQNKFIEDDSLANTFTYNEQVHAGYFIYGLNLKKIKLQAGLRAEQVFVGSKVKGDSNVYKNDYFSLYPSAHIKIPLSDTTELSLSYSRRVNRPHMHSLNPFPKFTDPFNLRRGNPYLNPEYINGIELGYMLYSKKITISSSVYYRYMTDLIKRVKVIGDNGVAETTWRNLDEGHFVGLEGMVIYKPKKWWRIMVSTNFAQNFINSNDAELNNSGFSWSAHMSQSFNLKNDWTIQHTAYYMSPFVLAQGRTLAMYSTGIAIKKLFLKKKLGVTLKVSDIFNTRRFALIVNENQDFTLESEWKWQSRRYSVALSYKFGKQTMHKPKRKQREGAGGVGM